jgi:hypothetical protein
MAREERGQSAAEETSRLQALGARQVADWYKRSMATAWARRALTACLAGH